jgi:hypothetical protein
MRSVVSDILSAESRTTVDGRMAHKLKDSSLGARLISLTNFEGLRRPDLADGLGSGLRTLCDISPHDTPSDVLRKTSDKFEQAIKELPGVGKSTAEEVRILAEVAYNIARYPESRKATLEDRRKWLADHEDRENWKGKPGLKPNVAYQTGRTKLSKHVIPQLERILLANWQTRFPEEPFPVDQLLPKDPELPDPPSPNRSHFLKRPVALVCIVVIVTTGIISAALLNSGTAHADCGASAKALEIKQPYGIRDAHSGWSVAYPADRSDSARQSLARLDQTKTYPENRDQFLSEQLDAGAYLYGGMKLYLEFVGLDEREVIVRDIRPIIHERPKIPVEAAILAPTQGGGVTQAYFALDDVRPAARIGNASDKRNGESPLLFDVKRFGVSRGREPEGFTLEFAARYSAFIFDVAVDYEVDGVTCTRIINRNGRPFQVAAVACPELFVADKNRDRDLQPLKAFRYKAIRDTVVDTATNKFVFTPLDPEIFASRCGGT